MSVESQVSDVMTSAQFSQESIPILVKGVEAQVRVHCGHCLRKSERGPVDGHPYSLIYVLIMIYVVCNMSF